MSTSHELTARIREELDLEPGIEVEDVDVTVDDGIVILTGDVNSLGAAAMAARCVLRVEGVIAVVNELCVRPGYAQAGHSAGA
jgi:osmotically-inducible protein OsmY